VAIAFDYKVFDGCAPFIATPVVDGLFRRTCHSSSGVEHPIRNRAVVSSILTCGSRQRPNVFAGVIQLVECQLPKLDVAGSSPVARFASVPRCRTLYNSAMFFAAPRLASLTPRPSRNVTHIRVIIAMSRHQLPARTRKEGS
jgi:hypothetical protein